MAAPMPEPAYVRAADLVVLFYINAMSTRWSLCLLNADAMLFCQLTKWPHKHTLCCQLRKWRHARMPGRVFRPVRPLVLDNSMITLRG